MSRQLVLSAIVAVLATVVVVAGAVALLRGGPGQTETSSDAVQESVPVSSPAAAQDSSARPDCLAGGVGGVNLPCLGGEEVAGEFAQVTLVNVWAWWCEPCRAELPVLEQFSREHPEVDVVGVHADANAANGIALLTELGVSYPSYQDDSGEFAGRLALPNVVPLLLVYKDGEQVGVFPQTYASVAELEAVIEEVV